MRNKYFTPVPEPEIVKMAMNGFDFNVRKKLVNEKFLDLAQLAERVTQIEKLNKEKEEYESSKKKNFYGKKLSYIEHLPEEESNSETAFAAEDLVQKAIEDGRLKFAEKPEMKVDADPFQITFNFTEMEEVFPFSANMATVEPLPEDANLTSTCLKLRDLFIPRPERIYWISS
ncbi:hypothetical protein PIB30_086415 [Stylosanthes scabra]|uniref:Uncharacterized protein n=1 Tax=Stylosanthes scabra TaxID=79078 RepID=A0ABU6ZRY2_9FABA|nr:hypothetical protein [Stylosanthes scabra]